MNENWQQGYYRGIEESLHGTTLEKTLSFKPHIEAWIFFNRKMNNKINQIYETYDIKESFIFNTNGRVKFVTAAYVRITWQFFCNSLFKSLYFSTFLASFCGTVASLGIAPSITCRMYVMDYYVWSSCLNFIIGLYVKIP